VPVSLDIEGSIPLAISRALAVAALLSLFGTFTFDVYVRPRATGGMQARDVERVGTAMLKTARLSAVAAALALLAWMLGQSDDMAGATG
jgi:hypothetical protein